VITTENTKPAEPIVYKNPTPVAVLLVPVVEQKNILIDGEYQSLDVTSLLYIIRGIEPKKGMLAMPGGFVDEKESIEMAALRELEEEVGLVVKERDIRLYKSEITPGNQVLVFCTTPEYTSKVLLQAKHNPEVEGFKIGNTTESFAFPLHAKVAKKFLNEQNLKNVNALGSDKIAAFAILKKMGYFSEDFTLE
jgi:ADP-ribose pyrophosphatase YjhB (NUDIX family)